MGKEITDRHRVEFLERAGYSIDLCRCGSGHSRGFVRVEPANRSEDRVDYRGRTIRSTIDKAIRAAAAKGKKNGRRKGQG